MVNLLISKSVVIFLVSTENLKTLKYHTFSKKQLFQLFAVGVEMKMKKCLEKKNQLRY